MLHSLTAPGLSVRRSLALSYGWRTLASNIHFQSLCFLICIMGELLMHRTVGRSK